MNTNSKVIGLTRLRMKPESPAPEADALSTRPSELLRRRVSQITQTGNYTDIVQH